MSRERFLTVVIVAILSGTVLFQIFESSNGLQHFIKNAVEFVAFGLGYLGLGELYRGGRRKLHRILLNCLILWFAIILILTGLLTHYKMVAYEIIMDDSIFLFSLLYATLFPLALYLNRNQQRKTSQSTIDNAG